MMVVKCKSCPIRKSGAFAPMRAEDVDAMQRFKVGELVVEPGTPLMMEGANNPQLYTALHGQGIRYKTLANGRRQVINFVFPGDFIGLQAAILSEMQHSVEATTSMVLCVFDRSEFFNFIKSNPQRAYDMIWASAVEEHFLGEHMVTLGQRSALERVSWAFARIWSRMTALEARTGASVPLPYRQQDLADALGLSLVHTNKTIAKLRSRQVANWSDGVLKVNDWDKLCEMAELQDGQAHTVKPLF